MPLLVCASIQGAISGRSSPGRRDSSQDRKPRSISRLWCRCCRKGEGRKRTTRRVAIRLAGYVESGGGGGIRTHEPFRVSGFQDRCNRPLYHPSGGAWDRQIMPVAAGFRNRVRHWPRKICGSHARPAARRRAPSDAIAIPNTQAPHDDESIVRACLPERPDRGRIT